MISHSIPVRSVVARPMHTAPVLQTRCILPLMMLTGNLEVEIDFILQQFSAAELFRLMPWVPTTLFSARKAASPTLCPNETPLDVYMPSLLSCLLHVNDSLLDSLHEKKQKMCNTNGRKVCRTVFTFMVSPTLFSSSLLSLLLRRRSFAMAVCLCCVSIYLLCRVPEGYLSLFLYALCALG